MKWLAVSAVLCATASIACAASASAADSDIVVTKAAPPAVTRAHPHAQACGSLWAFVVTDCRLTWHGITVYGAIDMGGGWQSHGAPFDPTLAAGGSYFLQRMNRSPRWSIAANGLSQSSIGIKAKEELIGGVSFIFALEAGFNPYSLQLANSPDSEARNNGVPLNLQSVNSDSTRAGQFYNGQGYVGVSSPTYGTLTVFRQNSLTADGVQAYDPMEGSSAFSPIGFSGLVAGAGDTENSKYSTSVKYRVDLGQFRAGALWQFGGYQLNNAARSAWQGQIGGDVPRLGPGVLSLDAIYTFYKDGVNLSLAGGPTDAAGMPIAPFLPQTLTATISNNTSVMLLAKYATGPLKLYGGYEWMRFAPPSDPQTSFTDIAGDFLCIACAGFNNTNIVNTAYGVGTFSDRILQVVWTGARYSVTENVDVVGAYYRYMQNDFTTADCTIKSAHSQCAGTMDAISAVVDWKFAAKFDAYAGIMYSQMSGGLVNGYLARNNLAPTAGLRFRF